MEESCSSAKLGFYSRTLSIHQDQSSRHHLSLLAGMSVKTEVSINPCVGYLIVWTLLAPQEVISTWNLRQLFVKEMNWKLLGTFGVPATS